MTNATAGNAVITAPRPAATANAIAPIPRAVPRMCGIVRRKPNVAPDAQSRMLFGPGVTELTNEKLISARSSFNPVRTSSISRAAAAIAAARTRRYRQWRSSSG